MRSFRRAALAFAFATTCAWGARAQQTVEGFGVERFYSSAPGGGWLVMDALDMQGRLFGGAAALTSGWASSPLRVTDGSQHLTVVSDQAFANFGFAATYDRFRVYLDLTMPLAVSGSSGTIGGYRFNGPSLTVGSNPDTLSDARIGFDARIVGRPEGPFRLGAGVQLFIPSGTRPDYVTDDTYRAMFRALFAGDVGFFTYAGHLGVHVRPRDEYPTPTMPRGSELLFGLAAGARIPVVPGRYRIVAGPEIYGATAFRSFFDTTATAFEGLLSSRFEGTRKNGAQLRVKLGAGAGLNPHFGAPAFRLVFAIEVFNHNVL